MQIYAEVKTHSPYGFDSPYSWDHLFKIANRIGDIIAVHAHKDWDGNLDLIRKAKSLTDKPIMAKGIFATDKEVEAAVDAGANRVLVVNRIPEVYPERCLIEPNSIAELRSLPLGTLAVWNSRDLETGGLKADNFNRARQEYLGYLCQASNIKSLSDIHPRAEAVLIGAALPQVALEIVEFGAPEFLKLDFLGHSETS